MPQVRFSVSLTGFGFVVRHKRRIIRNRSATWENQDNCFNWISYTPKRSPYERVLKSHEIFQKIHRELSSFTQLLKKEGTITASIRWTGNIITTDTGNQWSNAPTKVVAYFTRMTNCAENKYNSYEFETLAVVETLQLFRTYLIGIRLIVVSDCSAISTCKTKNRKE